MEDKNEHKRFINPSGLTPEQYKEIQKNFGKPDGSPGIDITKEDIDE